MRKIRPSVTWPRGLLMSAFFFLAAGPLHAAGFDVGAGSSFDLDTGSMDLDCGDLTVGGTLDMGTGTFNNVGSVIS